MSRSQIRRMHLVVTQLLLHVPSLRHPAEKIKSLSFVQINSITPLSTKGLVFVIATTESLFSFCVVLVFVNDSKKAVVKS